MTKAEIKVGGTYLAMVSNKLVEVRVDELPSKSKFSKRDRYTVTNLTTGRTVYFRSAAKFRPMPKPVKYLLDANGNTEQLTRVDALKMIKDCVGPHLEPMRDAWKQAKTPEGFLIIGNGRFRIVEGE